MGSATAGGVIAAGLYEPGNVTVADIYEPGLEKLHAQLGVSTTTSNAAAVQGAGIVMIVVKPAVVKAVLADIAEEIMPGQLIVSMAAGVKLESIESGLPAGTPVMRAMPNTPCRIREGAIGFARGTAATDEHAAAAKRLFDSLGLSLEVPEKLLDAVTGLSGSGPAYVFVMIDALSDAGVRVGLPREASTKLAAQTVLGAARMVIEEGEHPAKLRDQVTSPGGTTITGLDVLESRGFRSALIEAVKAATRRSEELA